MIKPLSSRRLVFRGSSKLVGSPLNGNFLGILELLAEYDTFLAKRIQKRVNEDKDICRITYQLHARNSFT